MTVITRTLLIHDADDPHVVITENRSEFAANTDARVSIQLGDGVLVNANDCNPRRFAELLRAAADEIDATYSYMQFGDVTRALLAKVHGGFDTGEKTA